MLPWEHVFALGRQTGLPEQIMGPLQTMYEQLVRHYRVGGMLSEGFMSTNGILQGCPISVVLLNLLMQVCCNMISTEGPGSKPRCYADDAQACGKEPAMIQRILDLTDVFCQLTGMRMHLEKCLTWATEADLRQQLAEVSIRGGQNSQRKHGPQSWCAIGFR